MARRLLARACILRLINGELELLPCLSRSMLNCQHKFVCRVIDFLQAQLLLVDSNDCSANHHFALPNLKRAFLGFQHFEVVIPVETEKHF